MASHLFGRFAHLLLRSSSQAPAAAAVRLPLLLAGPAAALRPKGWLRITERSMCNKTAHIQFLDTSTTVNTELEKLVRKAETPEDILSIWESHGANGNQAAWILIKWTNLMMKTRVEFPEVDSELLSDSRLQQLIKVISQHVRFVSNSNLLHLLQTLWIMKLPSDDPLLASVRTEVLWRLRRLTYKQLVLLLTWAAVRNEEEDISLLKHAIKQVELRWTEIADAKTVRILLSRGEYLTPSLVNKLEDKALELSESFTSEDIGKVCLSLAAQKRRSVPLLKALSYHLLQKPLNDFTTPLIMDLVFAYAMLSFNNSQVFQRLTSVLWPRVPHLSPVEVTRCAKSLGFLKWLHIPLFEAFAEHYTKNCQLYTHFQLSNLLMSFARLGFKPNNEEEFYSKVHKMLEVFLEDLDPLLRTNVAWSLCVLQQAKPHYLTPLCQQSYFTKLSGAYPNLVESFKLKLLHIAATLLLEHSDTSPCDLHVHYSSSSLSMLQNSLRQALLSLVDGRTEVLRTGVDTVYGWTIDGEMVIDCDNNPADISALKAPHLPDGGGDQNLPEGTRRLAFLAWEYPDFGSKSRDLLGRHVMKKRHLQLAGFVTVEVPYYEWLELKTGWQKEAYLKDKMGKSVGEDLAK